MRRKTYLVRRIVLLFPTKQRTKTKADNLRD